MPPLDLPGFYFDEQRQRYYPLLSRRSSIQARPPARNHCGTLSEFSNVGQSLSDVRDNWQLNAFNTRRILRRGKNEFCRSQKLHFCTASALPSVLRRHHAATGPLSWQVCTTRLNAGILSGGPTSSEGVLRWLRGQKSMATICKDGGGIQIALIDSRVLQEDSPTTASKFGTLCISDSIIGFDANGSAATAVILQSVRGLETSVVLVPLASIGGALCGLPAIKQKAFPILFEHAATWKPVGDEGGASTPHAMFSSKRAVYLTADIWSDFMHLDTGSKIRIPQSCSSIVALAAGSSLGCLLGHRCGTVSLLDPRISCAQPLHRCSQVSVSQLKALSSVPFTVVASWIDGCCASFDIRFPNVKQSAFNNSRRETTTSIAGQFTVAADDSFIAIRQCPSKINIFPLTGDMVIHPTAQFNINSIFPKSNGFWGHPFTFPEKLSLLTDCSTNGRLNPVDHDISGLRFRSKQVLLNSWDSLAVQMVNCLPKTTSEWCFGLPCNEGILLAPAPRTAISHNLDTRGKYFYFV